MIVLRKFQNNDLKNIEELLKDQDSDKFKLKTDRTIYLALVDEELIGAIQIQQDSEISILDYLFINEKWRNRKIGDGLLRAMIDKLDKNQVKSLEFYGMDSYLIKRGFKENMDNTLSIDVENFFNDGCSSYGNSDEI